MYVDSIKRLSDLSCCCVCHMVYQLGPNATFYQSNLISRGTMWWPHLINSHDVDLFSFGSDVSTPNECTVHSSVVKVYCSTELSHYCEDSLALSVRGKCCKTGWLFLYNAGKTCFDQHQDGLQSYAMITVLIPKILSEVNICFLICKQILTSDAWPIQWCNCTSHKFYFTTILQDHISPKLV